MWIHVPFCLLFCHFLLQVFIKSEFPCLIPYSIKRSQYFMFFTQNILHQVAKTLPSNLQFATFIRSYYMLMQISVKCRKSTRIFLQQVREARRQRSVGAQSCMSLGTWSQMSLEAQPYLTRSYFCPQHYTTNQKNDLALQLIKEKKNV